ncbi:MAG TPA: acyl-CoA dehydrogenase, partial [Gemmataceae bacterium]
RLMRDARINTIGEGANDVLKAFIAVVGARGPGMRLDALRKSLKARPIGSQGKLWRFVLGEIGTRLGLPRVPVQSPVLRPEARELGRLVKRLGTHLPWVFLRAGTEQAFLQAQYQQERLADAAIDLYVSACTISRLDHLLRQGARPEEADVRAGRHFLRLASRRIRQNLSALSDNDDASTTAAADAVLSRA